MGNSLYITLSRQLALFRDMDVTANNVANANTAGYNAEHVLFNSYLSKDINQGIPNPMSFAYDVASYRNTQPGPMQTTGNALDLAINGNAYFAVQTPLGVRYTRAGNFQLSGDGTLINANGYPVMDPSNQPIVFPDNVQSIEVGTIGNIKVNGDDFGALAVVKFENDQLLEQLGNGLYASDALPQQTEEVKVAQGMLEMSNVQPVKELTHMVKISRAVDSTAKFIATMYDLQRKAANTWAGQG